MKSFIAILIFGFLTCDARNYCCEPEHGVLEKDGNNCVNLETNVTSPPSLKCDNFIQLPNMSHFVIKPDDTLVLSFVEGDDEIHSGKYCVENSTDYERPTIAICIEEEENPSSLQDVYGYCMIVSAIFLILIVLVYSVLPKIRDVHGKSIITFCISLALGLFFCGSMKIFQFPSFHTCAVGSFLMFFFLLASFFWSNAITIQIYRSLERPISTDYRWRPFLWYSLYAWGCPALITIILIIVNYIPGDHERPEIGLTACWFADKYQQWYYMYSVMSILVAVNIFIFVYISIRLWRNSFTSTHTKAVKYKFWMTCKMCIIMGLPWIIEIISSLTEKHIIWTILDFFVLFHGPLLFLVLVVFRRRVIKELYNKGWLQCIAGCVERHLAVRDDEEDVVEHTIGVTLDEKL